MPSKHVTKFRGHKKKIDKLQACFLLWKIFKDFKGERQSVGNVCSPYNKQRPNFVNV